MEGRNMKLRGLIYGKFANESAFAKYLGWSRQRLSKITTGKKEPSLIEVRDMAKALGITFDDMASFFLDLKVTV